MFRITDALAMLLPHPDPRWRMAAARTHRDDTTKDTTHRAHVVVPRVLAVELASAVESEVAAHAVRVGRRGLPPRCLGEQCATALLAREAHVRRTARVTCKEGTPP